MYMYRIYGACMSCDGRGYGLAYQDTEDKMATCKYHNFCRILLNGESSCRQLFSCFYKHLLINAKRDFRERRIACNLVDSVRAASTVVRRSAIWTQFSEIKAQYKDYLLLFQVGDFYELYAQDAELAGGKTSLKVTKRQGIPMAGFPVKALNEWLKTLVEADFQLAICNQKGYW